MSEKEKMSTKGRMSKNEKRWIIVLVIIAIIAIVIYVVVTRGKNNNVGGTNNNAATNQAVNEEQYTEQLNDGTKLNTSETFNQTKTYGNLEISNVQFTSRNGMSVLLADVKNTGTTKHEKEVVKITILGDNGETITEIKPVIGEIEPGQTIKLNAGITADVANAKDYRIEAAN